VQEKRMDVRCLNQVKDQEEGSRTTLGGGVISKEGLAKITYN